MNLILLGDSIAEGLGVKGCSYADLLAPKIYVTNWAASAAQIDCSNARLPEIIAKQPDVVVIAHGITEAIVRPVPPALHFVPPRWRQIGWMDPRPYYSRRFWKRLYHKTESALRWRIKNCLIRRIGGQTLMPIDEFYQQLAQAVEALLCSTKARVILLTHSGIDEHFYPNSLGSLQHYQQAVVQVAAQAGRQDRVQVCDVSCLLDQWSDYFADHFHPNASGHAKIAKALCALLRQANSPEFAIMEDEQCREKQQ